MVALLPPGVAGLLVGLTIRHLPGRGGHSPADGMVNPAVPARIRRLINEYSTEYRHGHSSAKV